MAVNSHAKQTQDLGDKREQKVLVCAAIIPLKDLEVVIRTN